jgi:hypothetical protein
VTTAERVAIAPGFQGFVALAEAVGLDLERFQRKIAKAALGPERELLVLIARGNGKARAVPVRGEIRPRPGPGESSSAATNGAETFATSTRSENFATSRS